MDSNSAVNSRIFKFAESTALVIGSFKLLTLIKQFWGFVHRNYFRPWL